MQLNRFVRRHRSCTCSFFFAIAIVLCSALHTLSAFAQQGRSDPHRPSGSVVGTGAEAKTLTCPPQWGHGFHIPRFFGVESLATFDDGSGPALYIGGAFDRVSDTWALAIAKWDGENWAALPDTLGPYYPSIGVGPVVRAMVAFDDGNGPGLFVSGCFEAAGELVVNTIAKWDGQEWSALGGGIDEGSSCASSTGSPTVSALAVFDDGTGSRLYAAGHFASAGGVSASNIAKWDGTSWSGLGDGVDGTIYALAVFDDGSGPALYAGGGFQAAGGAVAYAIAKWDGIAWTAVLTGMDGPVYALAVYDDGNGTAVYAGGDFADANGVTANHIARWDGVSWSAVGGGLVGEQGVRTLIVFDDGSGPALYAGGLFTRAGDVDANRIAKWDGTSWSAVGGGLDPLPSGYDRVKAITVFDGMDGPRLLVAGLFQSVGGVYAHGMAQWDGTAWTPMPGPTGSGLDGWIFDLTPGDDGTGFGLFAGGMFTRGGSTLLNRIGKWDGTSWTPLGTGMDGQVNGITFFNDGRGPALFAVGAFDAAGGVPASRVARWDGGTWEPLGSGLGEGTDTVAAVAGIDEGDAWGLYAGGTFNIADGLPADHIARWDGTAWSEVAGGVGSWVLTLTAFDDGTGTHLYAGGYLRTAGGVAVNRVAKWDGVSWSAVGDGFSAEVQKLVVVDDGTGPALYAGWKHGISKWDGSQWVSIGITSSYGPVYGIDCFDDGTGPALFAAGYFYEINDVSARHIAKWDGNTWIPLEGYIETAIYDLAVFNDGDGPALFLGGDIRRTGDTVSSNIAKWGSPCPELAAIPAISDWGVAFMAFLIVGAAGVVISRRRCA